MNELTVRLLKRLLDAGAVPLSAVKKRSGNDIASLLHSGAVVEERAGGGGRLVMIHREAVEGMLRAARPDWESTGEVPPRAEAVRRFRNAKKATPDSPNFVLLRSCRDSCVWRNGHAEVDVTELTRRTGVAGIAVSPDDDWCTDAPLGMIENKEVFWHCDKLYRNSECGCFMYYAGNVMERVIAWFAKRPRAPRVLFFPDYDPVGLGNYLALKQACSGQVELVVPPDFEQLLKTWGKQDLLGKNTHRLTKILEHGDNEVRRLVELMQEYGCGLEQEILLTLA
ncbi:MAG: hypothetical protein K9N51_10645 [Candidatus Pacebacteria bacterium]|nr:hypothetical protein [Candidatus Paceibacterota bacterium]